ncbi:SPOR domain-containing protein [Microbulbifer aggregans]|uniref:SPOR domain-containing protein n=1 Tax=Microbulbifer aggregans TaxID=1769779 RepID=UPI001CFC84F9|nr:SPOR domain-containing protein [Microbulbifer aggregans]
MASRDSDPKAFSSGGKPRKRLNDGVKQRIIGALVLAALAVIFLPSLFDRQGTRYIDVTSQIPPAPAIQPIVIAEPEPVKEVAPAPPVNEVFQPEFAEQRAPAPDPAAPLADSSKDVAADKTAIEAKPVAKVPQAAEQAEPAATPAPAKATEEKVSLDKQGLPEGWVVQVGAYRDVASADRMRGKLLDAGFRAFTRSVETPKGRFVRVFVGPKLDKADAQSDKGRLDKLLNTQTLVLKYKV